MISAIDTMMLDFLEERSQRLTKKDWLFGLTVLALLGLFLVSLGILINPNQPVPIALGVVCFCVVAYWARFGVKRSERMWLFAELFDAAANERYHRHRQSYWEAVRGEIEDKIEEIDRERIQEDHA